MANSYLVKVAVTARDNWNRANLIDSPPVQTLVVVAANPTLAQEVAKNEAYKRVHIWICGFTKIKHPVVEVEVAELSLQSTDVVVDPKLITVAIG